MSESITNDHVVGLINYLEEKGIGPEQAAILCCAVLISVTTDTSFARQILEEVIIANKETIEEMNSEKKEVIN